MEHNRESFYICILEFDKNKCNREQIIYIGSAIMNYVYQKEWTKNLNNGNKNIIYIDIPFCKKICQFCIFNSVVCKSSGEISTYVEEILIPELEKSKKIFGNIIPEEVFFGGGTPSLLSIKQLEKIFENIPNFERIKVKAFEAHPESMSIEKVEYLIKKGFNYYTLGIQTLDPFVLKKINRVSVDIDKLKRIVKKIQNANGIVSLDLIAFLRKWDESDISYTISDLNILTNEIKPDIIVIHSNYKKYHPDLCVLKAVNDAVYTSIQHSEYYVKDKTIFKPETDLLQLGAYAYNIYRGDFEKIAKLKNYNCSGPGQLDPAQNVYAVGGIERRKIYSYIGGYKQWYQYFDDKNKTMCIEEVPYNTFLDP